MSLTSQHDADIGTEDLRAAVSGASNAEITQQLALEFDLTLSGIIRQLELLRPIYYPTAAYGHFGRDDLVLPWDVITSGVPS